MDAGKVKVFIAMGGNFLSATPDTQFTATALKKTKLTVQISTKLNRSHLIHGTEALILPCLARTDKDVLNGEEQFVSCENSMGIVHLSKGNLKPVSDLLLSEPVIVSRLAKATLGNFSLINWDKYLQHYDHIRKDIEETIPGFDNYNEKVRKPGGFYLPNSNRQGLFSTPSEKGIFNIAVHEPILLKEGEFMMMTIRSHDQFNTTIYGLNDRYRGINNERRIIFMNQYDINALGFTSKQLVNIHNNYEGIERIAKGFVVVPYPIPRSCTATYFPETNVLVPITSVADKSNTPTSKLIVITLSEHRVES